MAIKETPTKISDYYNSLISKTKQKLILKEKEEEEIEKQLKELKKEVLNNLEDLNRDYKLDLNSYEEFVENRYIDGKFLKDSRNTFINKKNDYTLSSDIYIVFDLARIQKKLFEIKKEIFLSRKILKVSRSKYFDILRIFYGEVHKQMILNGYGYSLGHKVGWICINRRRYVGKHVLDYAATKKRKEELISQGKRIFNKDEYDWCKQNGLDYDGVDRRVFKKDEFGYELAFADCKIKNNHFNQIEPNDYRGAAIRGKTNEDLLKDCNNDIDKILELPVSLKTKLNLCLKVNKFLYTKYIRNENQESINIRKDNRKNR